MRHPSDGFDSWAWKTEVGVNKSASIVNLFIAMMLSLFGQSADREIMYEDLVKTVFELVQTLDSELDHTNLRIMEKCIDTLTELLQGNTTRSNAEALLETTVLEVRGLSLDAIPLQAG